MYGCVGLGADAPSWSSGYVTYTYDLHSSKSQRLTCRICILPAVNVHLPKDRISMAHQGYGFCEFLTEEDAEYACKIMNQIKLWGKPIRVNKVSMFLLG